MKSFQWGDWNHRDAGSIYNYFKIGGMNGIAVCLENLPLGPHMKDKGQQTAPLH